MLKEIRYVDWKSFKRSTLYIDPLTILIGTNASGKSNALDGLVFLKGLSQGKDLQSALMGESTILLDSKINAVRGGVEWAARKPGTVFSLETLISINENFDYEYKIKVRTEPHVELMSESLVLVEYKKRSEKRTELFSATVEQDDSPSVLVTLYNGQKGRPKKRNFRRNVSILSQMRNQELKDEVIKGIETVISTQENVFILDPVPALMRDYTSLSNILASNAHNIAGVIAAYPDSEQRELEKQLSGYVTRLPEGDIRRVWAESVGRFKNDAMLYCEEKWSTGSEELIMDAKGMSDGTLRFLGILTALLTRPQNTLIVIEEIDNGLHPSRAQLLLKMLKEIGMERKIDILMTTHNPALMDALGPEMVPFVITAHRSSETGESKLTLLEDIENLPKLLAVGPIGKIVTSGRLEEVLSKDKEGN
ncbi:ATP-binding protein [Cohnella lubricantis]|uniref:ATP-binding protein n=1 Tax=Cohnella lubricantis TaxID=2163172 RepID=A0A841T9B5_9BACL|nr:ATP-binding protein [Cohnella lubricantis]MBB6678103.1 ATP-binding protein [Cohnella lubricantis]MBP2120465.1 AAA15 family ATPase/GTPase [Cohnella lubricantis]